MWEALRKVQQAVGLGIVTSLCAACGGSGDGDASSADPGVTSEPHPGTLLVLDSLGEPMPNLRVLVAGSLLTTDAHGSAALPNLPPKYDIVTRVSTRVFAFDDLTSDGPTVKLRSAPPPDPDSKFGLEVDATPAANQNLLLTLDIKGEGVEHPRLSNMNPGFSIGWDGAQTASLSVEAFLVDLDPNTQAIVNYAGYAQQTWTAVNGMASSWQPVFSAPPFATTTIHLDATPPPGSAVMSLQLLRMVDWFGATATFSTFQSGASADFLVPATPSPRYEVVAHASDGQNTSNNYALDVAPGAKVSIKLPTAPAAIAPVEGAMGVNRDTEFSWTSVEDAIYELDAVSDQSIYWYQIYTTATSAHLPDTRALNLDLPQEPTFQWTARSFNHVSLAAFAAGAASFGSGASASRAFTTALPVSP